MSKKSIGMLGWGLAMTMFLGPTLKLWAQGKLELKMALPLDGPEFIQPSGLVMAGKDLLMVAGDHDGSIFQVTLQADKAVYKEWVTIKRPKDSETAKFAFRGIASDGKNNFFLISGAACRILKVESGGHSEWTGPSLLDAGVEKGLFAGENSGAEGILYLGPQKYLVAASREPRGLLVVDLSRSKSTIKPILMDNSKHPIPKGRHKPDFTDLANTDKNQLWALESAADAICLLKHNGDGFEVGEYWSYSHVTEDSKYRYKGLKMGLGRGIALDSQYLYLVLDNKGVSREADPVDKRPLLLVFTRPR